ncbi:MAG: DUF177 domain-containing protein [Coriobacteriales bacterium]|jgi:uncharacterized protein|nr:DUF177 domain-containing protein [Coriobacteriales bacterium]
MSAELKITLAPTLDFLGAHLALQGVLDIFRFDAGGRAFVVDKGISYNLELTNTGGAVLVSGVVKANTVAVCDRCLASCDLQLQGELQEYLVIKGSQADFSDADAEFTVVDANEEIDLAAYMIAALIFELPITVLCKDECKGLCPRCGTNLNTSTCNCDGELSADHPFAVLKSLL